ncbi:unnamed protein product [Parascedosporium putredinis]|uniref:Uncharacterized protein n=1 Tax=Parascedosporium putredinis TaxID=1442378 RepID=A0A9P1H0N7_9PEZI|nr:unnamed protein product [Parascedosporium putredinis]CAI7994112.1 unnamed protein product [Parascedosporium putredinis]
MRAVLPFRAAYPLTDVSPGASDQALAGSSSSDSPTGVIGIDLEFTDDLDWQANPLSYDFEHDLGFGAMSGEAPFVHARQWLESEKNDYLAAVESIAQLCANGPVRSQDFLLNAIKGELEKIQAQCTKGSRSDDVAAMQAITLYTVMRTCHTAATDSDLLSRISSSTISARMSTWSHHRDLYNLRIGMTGS